MYEPSYLNDSYDTFSADDDFKLAMETINANSIHHIDNIKKREDRMFKKLSNLQNTQTSPNNDCTNCCGTNVCDVRGSQRFQLRRKIKENVEDYQQLHDGSQEVRNEITDARVVYPSRNTQLTKSYPEVYLDSGDNNYKGDFMERLKRNNYSYVNNPRKSNTKTESFSNQSNDIKFLQKEIDDMEKKNNNLVIFIFLLVVIVLVQYTKINNDPVKVMFLPTNSSGNNSDNNSGATE